MRILAGGALCLGLWSSVPANAAPSIDTGSLILAGCKQLCKERASEPERAIVILAGGKSIDAFSGETNTIGCFCKDLKACFPVAVTFRDIGKGNRWPVLTDVADKALCSPPSGRSKVDSKKMYKSGYCSNYCKTFGDDQPGLLVLHGTDARLQQAAVGTEGTCYCTGIRQCFDVHVWKNHLSINLIRQKSLPVACEDESAGVRDPVVPAAPTNQ